MAKDMKNLREQGLIETDNLKKMTENDILAYIGLMKARGLKDNGQTHNISALRALLRFCDNTVMDCMKPRYSHVFPKKRTRRYPPIENFDVDAIHQKADTVFDWRRLEAYSMVILALNTGLRSKEHRLAKIGDVDREAWTMIVRHPKGEGRYGQERIVPILPPARPILTRYFAVRADMISKYAPHNEALFPALRDKGDGFLSSQSQRMLKKIVSDETGIDFELRACRRTFGQLCIDRGAQVETVSLLLGHQSTKTTEGYYCRKREDVALREISEIWKPTESIGAKNLLIENKNDLSGYA